MSSHIDILDARRKDFCKVERYLEITENGITRNGWQQVDEKIRCHLSIKNTNVPAGEQAVKVVNTYVLFARPEIDLMLGDKITVTKPNGVTYELYAGKPTVYTLSSQTVCSEEQFT